MSLLTVALVVAALATIYSFVGGLSSMVAGRALGHHTSEQWMIMRIAFQAVAVVLLLVFVMLK